MNFWKKNYKEIIYILVIIFLIVCFLWLFLGDKKNKINFITSPHEYIIINDGNSSLNIPVYISEKNSPYLTIDAIKECYLRDGVNNDYYLLKIESINLENQIEEDNIDYYLYDLKVFIPFTSDEIIKIKNAYLELCYINEEVIKLKIGSFVMCNSIEQNLSYSSLYGHVKKVNDCNMLVAVSIKLDNEEPIIIKKAIVLSNLAFINNIKLNDKNMFDDYDVIGEENNNYDINVNSGETLDIYLKYDQYIECNTIGLIITYEINGMLYDTLVHPFMFFKTNSNVLIEKKQYVPN